jgi:hypothetical protein
MSGPVAAILLTLIVHFIGFILLFADARQGHDRLLPGSSSGGGDGGMWPEPEPPADPAPSGTGIPLPDADPSSVRLREPGRIAERYDRRPRRPDHAPEPARTPERV